MNLNFNQSILVTANMRTMELDDMPLYANRAFSLETILEITAREFEIPADEITSLVITWVPSRETKND